MIRQHFEQPPLDYQQQQQQQQHQQQLQLQATQQQQQISKIVSSPPPTIIGTPNGTTMCVAKLIVGLDHAPMAFNVRQRVIGDGGTNLNYIRSETGAIVTLRGRGSLTIEPQTGLEAPEPLQLCIEHPTLEGFQQAKQLAKNLIETLQEELTLFQENIAPKQNFQLLSQPALVQTTQVPQMAPMIRAQHITQPNGMMHQPPPPVIQQGFVQHPQSQPPPPQIIQQPPTIIQSHVPVQIHQQPSNVVISQIQTAPQLTNVNNPPPGTQIRPSIMQIKNTMPPHLSQPPPSMQISQPAEAPQQILVNQAPPYQVQYIQQNPPIQTSSGPHPAGQVTIQHVIQPQPQPIQGIMQTTLPPPQFDQFQRPPQGQQIITVQGSTSFMVPPPNIVHQTMAPQPPNQIIVQSQPMITHPPPNSMHQELIQSGMQPPMGPPPMAQVPMVVNGTDDKKPGEMHLKPDQIKLEEGPPPGTIIQQITKQSVIPVSSMQSISLSQPPPPIMSVPPPTVQHIVGNTIITSQPNHSISHAIPQQIYNQIPVSIQSFQSPPQQIHVNGGTHFVVNTPQPWPPNGAGPPPQIQQVPVSSVQNIQFAPQPMRNPNEIQFISTPAIISAAEYRPPQQHIITTSSFNPQMQPPQGVQVIHTVPPPHQQIITSIPNAQPQIIEAPPHSVPPPHPGATHQIITTPVPPPPAPFTTVQYTTTHHDPKQSMEMQQHQQIVMRPGQKRKHPEDDSHKNIPPKMGMGMNLNSGSVTAKSTMSASSTATVTTSSTSGGLITSQISSSPTDELQNPENVGPKSGNELQSDGEQSVENFGAIGVGSSNNNINSNNSTHHSGPKQPQQQSTGGNNRPRGSYRGNQPYYVNNSGNGRNNNNGSYQLNSYHRNFEPTSQPPPPPKCRW
ncbi:protein transport protein SEC31-like isoform X1 [Wyeomyia smithii]|uniref:protein transport protein SEC31-like isoform X1 n=2 Tax=Wyeomyia smithii TaxID=174621 RepID=UPI002468092E|nr:protein transport protein SEC31-like isoform X1 [Wyeomyia smithii]XP_055537540.1 protein transport protein SEC31-like isoform X1 [Wyeomyia smithii]XP_055537541.1 protein transport protein SEC31-like isoform X1 [Wyeomyia smithii]